MSESQEELKDFEKFVDKSIADHKAKTVRVKQHKLKIAKSEMPDIADDIDIEHESQDEAIEYDLKLAKQEESTKPYLVDKNTKPLKRSEPIPVSFTVPNESQEEPTVGLREAIAALKPHTKNQLPVGKLLSHRELDAIIALVEQHIERIIGEDEFTDTVSTEYRQAEIRNQFRAEMRKRMKGNV